jgi:trans-aconitate methyltransferase
MLLSRPGSIIEMGCGTGNLLRFLTANFTDVRMRGLDDETSLVAIARAAAPEIPVTGVDYLHAIPDDEYDAVIFTVSLPPQRRIL